jgi:hypothetical protein
MINLRWCFSFPLALLLGALLVVLPFASGCGSGTGSGSGSGGGGGQTTYYTVTATPGTGATITPASISVAAGSTASFTVGLQAGYQNLVAVGCTISGTTCTTGPINANAAVSDSATPIPPPTYTVSLVIGAGTTGTLTSTTVQAGQTDTVTGVGLVSGYYNLVVSGCVLSGTTCTTGPINANTTITLSATSNAYSLIWDKVSPGAVFDANYATTPINVEVGATGTGFHLVVAPTQPLSTGYNDIPLQDTHTTDNGGEVYSATITPGVSAPALRYYRQMADTLGFIIFALDANNNVLTSTGNDTMNSYVEVGIVSSTLQLQPSQVTQPASGVFATPNSINIVQAYVNPLNIAGVTQAVYNIYPDVFDNFVVSNSRADSLASPAHFDTNTSVLGTGNGGSGGDSISPPSSTDSVYGSNGLLKGVTQESPVDALQKAFLHEFGHNYAFNLNNSSLDFTRGNGAHQLALCSNPVGWLGGNQYMVQQKDGDFVVTEKPDGTYSDLELYLMGLEPASAVPNQYCVMKLQDPEQIGDTIPFSTTTSVAMTDIVGVYGTRSPSYATSQKSFRVLFVWLSENTPTAAELALHDDISAFYGSSVAGEINSSVFPPLPYPFAAATKGNGTLVTTVPAHK